MDIPIILDIEASGFGQDSYPIEVGVIMPDGRKFCFLIKPQADWQHWDPSAEQLHRIERQTLVDSGEDVKVVAYELNNLLAGMAVYSDGLGLDMHWIQRLFTAAEATPEFELQSIDKLLSYTQQTIWHETHELVKREYDQDRQRASMDAEIIQLTYIRTAKLIGYSNVRRRKIH